MGSSIGHRSALQSSGALLVVRVHRGLGRRWPRRSRCRNAESCGLHSGALYWLTGAARWTCRGTSATRNEMHSLGASEPLLILKRFHRYRTYIFSTPRYCLSNCGERRQLDLPPKLPIPGNRTC
ncbi:hypothetical protein NDU88_003992 [Pleurodeles waltl]|uniref:Uncharacterized protein n=1 Tax=Pleurodeles waltl TaxID=8319 RepID=A0AAV7WWE8_PLEWA|nr:hypothetical protein NDU88_003992 [Pleurodeles waltl]